MCAAASKRSARLAAMQSQRATLRAAPLATDFHPVPSQIGHCACVAEGEGRDILGLRVSALDCTPRCAGCAMLVVFPAVRYVESLWSRVENEDVTSRGKTH